MKKIIAVFITVVVVAFAGTASAWYPRGSSGGGTGVTTFAPTKIGAGGWLVGIDIQCDSVCGNGTGTSTKIVRPDTTGAFLYDSAAANPGNAGGLGRWNNIINSATIPAGDNFLCETCPRGAIDIKIAPSNTSHLYMHYAKDGQNTTVYSSINKGVTWTRSTLPTFLINAGSNDGHRQNGPFLAIDPANENVVYAGTISSGVFVTIDGGANWSTVISATGVANGSWSLPFFDKSGGVTGSGAAARTNNIVILTNGTGVYRSTNAGGSWAALNSAGMPTVGSHLFVDQSGIIWVVGGGQFGTGDSNVRFYKAGAWNTVSTGASNPLQDVVVDKYNANAVFIVDIAGGIGASYTKGATWTYFSSINNRVATDIPWLQNTNENYMSTAAIAIDPAQTQWTTSTSSNAIGSTGQKTFVTATALSFVAGRSVTVYQTSNAANMMQGTVDLSSSGTSLVLNMTALKGSGSGITDWTIGSNVLMIGEGIGVWYSTPPLNRSQVLTWTSISSGIEQLVPRWIVSPWGSSACTTLGTLTSVPIFTTEDRNFFVLKDQTTFPAHHAYKDEAGQAPIQHGWSAAWAGQAPQSVMVWSNVGWTKTSDCGATWTAPSFPVGTYGNGGGGAAVAATTTNNMIIQQSNKSGGYYTTDGGSSWNVMVYNGVPTAGHLLTNSTTTSPLSFASIPPWLSTGVASGASYTWYDLKTNASGTVTGTTSNTVTTSGNSGAVASGDVIIFQTLTGFGSAGFTEAQLVAADYVTDQEFYAYNMGASNCNGCTGIYKSSNGGATWAQECSGVTSPITCPNGVNKSLLGQIRAVPRRAAEFWVTNGGNFSQNSASHPNSEPFWKCLSNAGVTTCSQPNANVKEVWAFGFGKAKPGGSGYPAIFIYGFVTTINATNAGLYRSDDAGLTWTSLSGQYPGNSLDAITTVEGDANNYGNVYVGFGGTGWQTGTLN